MAATITFNRAPGPEFQRQQSIEEAWQIALAQLSFGSNEIILPANIQDAIGQDGLQIVVHRFGAYLHMEAGAYFDVNINALRIRPNLMPRTNLTALPTADTATTATATPTCGTPSTTQIVDAPSPGLSNRKKTPRKGKSEVPRPPNAFILYRQHHHPVQKANNPDLHNNDISKIIGKMWKAETKETVAVWKEKAQDAKKKHQELHPGYQYQPRKPGEKKKRESKKAKAGKAAAKAATTPDFELARGVVSLNVPFGSSGDVVNNINTFGRLTDRHNGMTGLQNFNYHEPAALSVQPTDQTIEQYEHWAAAANVDQLDQQSVAEFEKVLTEHMALLANETAPQDAGLVGMNGENDGSFVGYDVEQGRMETLGIDSTLLEFGEFVMSDDQFEELVNMQN